MNPFILLFRNAMVDTTLSLSKCFSNRAVYLFFRLVITILLIMSLDISTYCQVKEMNLRQAMAGISNQGRTLEKPYLTAGNRSYLVGTQDGDFPDMGSHIKGEMGGLWIPPLKLLDGFWLKCTDEKSGSASWLNKAREFINFPYGNQLKYGSVLDSIQVERWQFCPEDRQGIVVKYILKNPTWSTKSIKLDFVVKTDLSPVWFSKENNIIDGPDSVLWDDHKKIVVARDLSHDWFVVVGSKGPGASQPSSVLPPKETRGLGKTAGISQELVLPPKKTTEVIFVICGSNQNLASAWASYEDISKHYFGMLQKKKAYYASVIQQANIDIPDKKLQEAYTWGKINTRWLVLDLPKLGRFLEAGAIEYPWLFGCDNSYALQGVVASGDPELAKSTLKIIKDVSEKVNDNGRIIHEMSSNGFVGNKGNTQETAHFAVAVWKVFEWTGDVQFLREMYPYVKKGIDWLLGDQDKNQNMFPEGYGIMEVKGLNAELIDVAVYTQQDLEVASKMSEILQEPAAQKEYAEKAALLKDRINLSFWDEAENSYCDFYGTREQAITAVKGDIEQNQLNSKIGKLASASGRQHRFDQELLEKLENLPKGTEKGWLISKNWVISTPLETGLAPFERGLQMLDKVHSENTGTYGPYLSAVEKTRMMTISTGVQAMAECAYGRTDQAMGYVGDIVQTFNKVLPGSISEMMPDYGCPVQAWTIYGLVTPLVTHVFGIHPNAYNRTIEFAPHLPSAWSKISISHLPVGENLVAFTAKKTKYGIRCQIASKLDRWKMVLKFPGLEGKKYKLNGRLHTAGSDTLTLTGKKNILEVHSKK